MRHFQVVWVCDSRIWNHEDLFLFNRETTAFFLGTDVCTKARVSGHVCTSVRNEPGFWYKNMDILSRVSAEEVPSINDTVASVAANAPQLVQGNDAVRKTVEHTRNIQTLPDSEFRRNLQAAR